MCSNSVHMICPVGDDTDMVNDVIYSYESAREAYEAGWRGNSKDGYMCPECNEKEK